MAPRASLVFMVIAVIFNGGKYIGILSASFITVCHGPLVEFWRSEFDHPFLVAAFPLHTVVVYSYTLLARNLEREADWVVRYVIGLLIGSWLDI